MIVIADDLTGANDTGVQFVKQGKETIVHLTTSQFVLDEEKVNVINTDSRALLPEKAYEVNRDVAKRIKTIKTPFVFKKIDSTLRGNIGIEIEAFMDEYPFTFCAFAPAYPQNGRKTIGGYHIVNGELLEDSSFSRDVKFPMTESYIPKLLTEQTNRKVGHVPLHVIRSRNIAEEVNKLRDEGAEIIVFDSATDEDLKTISSYLKGKKDVLFVGSAGLANALSDESEECEIRKVTVQNPNLPVLTIAGSMSEVTREQIDYQKERGNTVIPLHPLHLLKSDEEQLERSLVEAKEAINNRVDTVITTSISNEATESLKKYKEEMNLDDLEVGNRIAQALGRFASQLVKEVQISGLLLTGGDIAYQTCLQLNIHSLNVLMEIEEGIPLSQAVNSPFENLMIVTKAGGFGQETSLFHAQETIKSF